MTWEVAALNHNLITEKFKKVSTNPAAGLAPHPSLAARRARPAKPARFQRRSFLQLESGIKRPLCSSATAG